MPPPVICLIFFLMLPPPPRSTLFPYTTLFRSARGTPVGPAPGQPCRGSVAELLRGLRHLGPSRLLRRSGHPDRKSTRLNSSHGYISYAVFCLKKKKKKKIEERLQTTKRLSTYV